jgi:sugar/nucleoside kinase (ribokinase family)
MDTMDQQTDYVAFNIILDDLVFADGRTRMGVLGGGGPQTAFGMRLWSERVGLAGGVGPDFPVDADAWLEEAGIDQQGLRRTQMPTPRAWQVTEASGLRTQVWRVGSDVIRGQLARSLDRLPQSYRRARGYHLGVHPLSPDYPFIDDLIALDGMVSLECFCPAAHLPEASALQRLVSVAEVFSLNAHEAWSLVGKASPRELAARLLGAGAKVLCLRLGAEGSLVADAVTQTAYQIPAFPATVVDAVGAGNAYSGGFLVGWCETGDLQTAGLYGAVSASFMLEQVGLPVFRGDLLTEALKRVEVLRGKVQSVAL